MLFLLSGCRRYEILVVGQGGDYGSGQQENRALPQDREPALSPQGQNESRPGQIPGHHQEKRFVSYEKRRYKK